MDSESSTGSSRPKSYNQVDQLVFQIEGRKQAPFKVYLPAETGTIGELKQLIQVQVGIEASRQTLRYNGETLDEDDRLASEEGFEPQRDVFTLKLTVAPPGEATFTIVVFGAGQDLEVEVTGTTTVLQLKNKLGMSDILSRELGMSVSSQSMALWYKTSEMKDKKKLSYYHVHEGSRISMEIK